MQESGEITRQSPIAGLGPAPALVDAALELEEGEVGGPVTLPQGAVLFVVTARTGFDASRFAAERDELREELARAEANKLLASVLAKRRDELGVTYDPFFVERFGLGGSRG